MKMKCSFGNGKCAYCDVAILRSFINFFLSVMLIYPNVYTRKTATNHFSYFL
jgi:hypothetical protein